MKKPVNSKTEVAAATTVPVAKVELNLDDFARHAGEGLENVTSRDVLIPRLGILQALSPQANKRRSEYIPDAEPGLIADLGTGELFPDGVWFLPVLYRMDWLEWAPRESDKGLVRVHADASILEQCEMDDRGRPCLSNGNYIAETAQFFGLNLTAGGRSCFVPMTSTQLKKAKRWNVLALGERLKTSAGVEFQAPLWYRTYNLGTAEESNARGEWFGWTVARGLALPEINPDDHGYDQQSLKDRAIALRKSLAEGRARVDHAPDSAEEGAM